ncbi:2579_t:CDS:2 [Funneliformis geosporum]|nr:2579_t:CDS:2 [Funneliformis geosporum]
MNLGKFDSDRFFVDSSGNSGFIVSRPRKKRQRLKGRYFPYAEGNVVRITNTLLYKTLDGKRWSFGWYAMFDGKE